MTAREATAGRGWPDRPRSALTNARDLLDRAGRAILVGRAKHGPEQKVAYTPAVRIAFSGSHCVGKSTLVEHVAEALPRYTTVDEPYYVLEEEGYECSETPSVADFEAQLERSLVAIEEGEQNVLFDRCPADIFAYLLAHDDAGAFEADDWLERTREAMQTLDLVVFVPIEERDRIALPSHEDRGYRLAVHERLHHLLVEDALGFETEVLAVHGDLPARVDQVMTRIGDQEERRPKWNP